MGGVYGGEGLGRDTAVSEQGSSLERRWGTADSKQQPPPPNPAASRDQPELGGGMGMRLNPRSLFARSLGTALREAGA